MDVVTGGRDCPINTNKHTLQLNANMAILGSLYICGFWPENGR
jgi:hypothetical protein